MNRRMTGRSGQSGAAAVEFAFVFPVLFMLMYGVIVYSYIFILQESITYAAQEAVEAAVAVDPEVTGADAAREANARATAVSVLAWLPSSQRARVLGAAGKDVLVSICQAGTAGCPADSDAVTVTVTFMVAETGEESLFPVLNLYILGSVPRLPEKLVARSTATI